MKTLLIITGAYSLLLHVYAFRQVEKMVKSKKSKVISYIWYTPVFVFIALSLYFAVSLKY